MKKSKFTEEQIVAILRETDRDPVATGPVSRRFSETKRRESKPLSAESDQW